VAFGGRWAKPRWEERRVTGLSTARKQMSF